MINSIPGVQFDEEDAKLLENVVETIHKWGLKNVKGASVISITEEDYKTFKDIARQFSVWHNRLMYLEKKGFRSNG